MSLTLDTYFAHRLRLLLNNFRDKGTGTTCRFEFACPFCGMPKERDRKANLFKSTKDALRFYCYRCNESMWMIDLLHRLDSTLAREYLTQSAALSSTNQEIATAQAPAEIPTITLNLPSIASLSEEHSARVYLAGRKIPEQFFSELLWTDDFHDIAEQFRPDGHYIRIRREGRIIIPIRNEQGGIIAAQGRSIEPGADIRYITVKTHENAPKVWGMDRINRDETIYVTEGPFDAMFLPNSIALCGSDILDTLPKENAVIIYDNEPWSQQTLRKLKTAIGNGHRICIWPDYLREKDVNQMVFKYSPEIVRDIIDENTWSGVLATMKYNSRYLVER